MVTIYFSGTGNSKYLSVLFSEKMGILHHSIEEDIDFEKLITTHEHICFCYPVHNSRMPRIMKDFAKTYASILKGKKIIIFCTQLIFSGDGARSFVDLFPKHHFEVIYAEHFDMPTNISNLGVFNKGIFRVTNGVENDKCLEKLNTKIDQTCQNITKGIVRKCGFSFISRMLGLLQGAFADQIEEKAAKSVKVNDDCIGCKTCVACCPTHNLELEGNQIIQKGRCTVCYRCVNKCPKQAIITLFDMPVGVQYKGIRIKKSPSILRKRVEENI